MKNSKALSERRARLAGLIALLALCLASASHAVKTNNVEIGRSSVYDGQVNISRDAQDRMTFQDTDLTVPVTLSSLTQRSNSLFLAFPAFFSNDYLHL